MVGHFDLRRLSSCVTPDAEWPDNLKHEFRDLFRCTRSGRIRLLAVTAGNGV